MRIQRRQRIGLWFCLLIGITFLCLAALRLQELLPNPYFDAAEQARLRPYSYPFLVVGALGIGWSGAFLCPRCEKHFNGRYRGRTLIRESRCQHCNLKAGGEPKVKSVR